MVTDDWFMVSWWLVLMIHDGLLVNDRCFMVSEWFLLTNDGG